VRSGCSPENRCVKRMAVVSGPGRHVQRHHTGSATRSRAGNMKRNDHLIRVASDGQRPAAGIAVRLGWILGTRR